MSRIRSWLWNQIVGYYKWKKGDNTDIIKLQKKFYLVIVFQQFKKTEESHFYQNLWMNVWRSLIAHIYSIASITTTFTSKLSHSPINLQLKVPQAVTPPPLNAVVPITFPSWNAMFPCRQTWTRRSTGRNKNIDFRLSNGFISNNEYANGDGDRQVTNSIELVHGTWPIPSNSSTAHDQCHRAGRWRNDSCGRFMGRLVHRRSLLSRLFTVLTNTWPHQN